MLFSDISRTDPATKRHDEASFAHLDRRQSPVYDRIRTVLEDWYMHLPDEARHEIRQRFRSGKDEAFHSAFLELYLHELLLRTGHTLTIHPELATTPHRPDFRAVDRTGTAIVVEGTVVTEVSQKSQAAESRLNELRAAIERLDLADYLLELEIEGQPETPIPITRLCNQIKEWVTSLDRDAVRSVIAANWRKLPMLNLEHDGLQITIRPLPKKRARGRTRSRNIEIEFFEAVWVTSRFEIRDAVKKKAVRYGQPQEPYLVVVNCLGTLCDEQEIDDALFGREGLWPGDRSNFTRLSAFFAIHHLLPWSVPRVYVRLFHNPHAARPYSGPLTQLPQATLDGGKIRRIDGLHPRTILDLDLTWPKI